MSVGKIVSVGKKTNVGQMTLIVHKNEKRMFLETDEKKNSIKTFQQFYKRGVNLFFNTIVFDVLDQEKSGLKSILINST